MGVWGYGPFDNDDAANMIALASRDVKRVVTAKSDRTARYRYASARAAVQLMMIADGTDILGGPSLEMGLRALARMRSDEVWLRWHREPSKIARRLSAELRAVQVRLRGRGSGWRQRSKDERDELNGLVRKALKTKVPRPVERPKLPKRTSKQRVYYE